MGYALALGGVSFDRKTEPATRPTNAGKINMNVHPWTLPMVPSKRKETALAAQQHTPLTLVAETGNRFLSINEPTIAKTVPTSSAGKNDWDKIAYPKPSVLPKLRCSTRAYRNTPPIVRTAPVGKTQFHALISLSISLTPLTTELSINPSAEAPPSEHLAARFPKPGYHAAPQKPSAIDRFKAVSAVAF